MDNVKSGLTSMCLIYLWSFVLVVSCVIVKLNADTVLQLCISIGVFRKVKDITHKAMQLVEHLYNTDVAFLFVALFVEFSGRVLRQLFRSFVIDPNKTRAD